MYALSSLAAALLALSASAQAASCIDCTCISNTTYQCHADNARTLAKQLIAENTKVYSVGRSATPIKTVGDCCFYGYLPNGGGPSYARDLGYGLNSSVITKCAKGTGFLGGFGYAGGNRAESLTIQKCGTLTQYPPYADHKGPLPGQPDCCAN